MCYHRRRLTFQTMEPRRVLSAEAESTVFVNIPDNLTGVPGEMVTAPVNIDNAAGIRGAEIRIAYDTALLDADEESVLAGSVWPDDVTEVVVNVDDDAGSIVAFVFAAEGLDAGSGSLLEIRFEISNQATVGASTVLDLTRVRLNEGDIAPDPEPGSGSDSTDGRITFVAAADTASVTGFVYADVNTNNQPDMFEGVPRVRVMLVRTGDGQQRETFTNDDGRYRFDDLVPGSYRIQQQQPAAFLDGGPNEILVEVAAGQTLSGQNFRERGLRPEFVYSRLFTTAALPVGSPNWVTTVRRIVNDAEEAQAAAQSQLASEQSSTLSSASAAGEIAAAILDTGGAQPTIGEGEPLSLDAAEGEPDIFASEQATAFASPALTLETPAEIVSAILDGAVVDTPSHAAQEAPIDSHSMEIPSPPDSFDDCSTEILVRPVSQLGSWRDTGEHGSQSDENASQHVPPDTTLIDSTMKPIDAPSAALNVADSLLADADAAPLSADNFDQIFAADSDWLRDR